jgi:peptide/nickel transport system substrate-binding protein
MHFSARRVTMMDHVGRLTSVRRVASAAAAVLALVACGAGSGSSPSSSSASLKSAYSAVKGTRSGQLVFSDWEQVTDLNPISTGARTTAQATNVIWSFLWWFGPDNKPVPDLVTEVPTVENGLVKKVDNNHMDVTVKLKPGLRWSDGTPITTADVKFTWDAICDPSTGAANPSGYDHISSMDLRSDTEMVWHFGPNKSGVCGLSSALDSGIYAPYLLLGLTPVQPMHVLQGVPHANWHTAPYFTQKPTVSSGPYMVQNFVAGSSAQVVMVPNPHYADGRGGASYFAHAPYLDRLIYKIYGDKPAQINALRTGDTDAGLDLIANDLPALQSITQDSTVNSIGLLSEFVVFNTSNNEAGCAGQRYAETCGTPSPFKGDQALRQALALATDKQTMVKQLVGGIGKVMNSPFMPNFAPWYDSSLPAFSYNVAKANQMLDQDGWTKAADGTRSKNGHPLQFTLATTTGNAQRAAEEELLIHDWGLVGARVTTDNHPAGEMFGGFSESGVLATGQFDAALFAANFSPDPDAFAPYGLLSQIPSSSQPTGGNWGRWRDDRLNALLLQGESNIDAAQRQPIYNQAQAEWQTYAGMIELYARPDVFTYAPFFGNFAPGSPNLASWNAADWFRKTGVS